MPDTENDTPDLQTGRREQLEQLGRRAIEDLRTAAHLLREGCALLPPGPWFTWLYEGGKDRPLGAEIDGEPEWAIRAGGRGEHLIVLAREAHTTALAYLSNFSPDVANVMAEQFEQLATRAAKTLGEAWTHGDVGLLHIARNYLATIGPNSARTAVVEALTKTVKLTSEEHGTIGLHLGKQRVGAIWGPAADGTGEWFASRSELTGAVELPAQSGRHPNRAVALVALLNGLGFGIGDAL